MMFDVWLYTSARKEYAEAILTKIDPEGSIFVKKLFRENCIEDGNGHVRKDLSVVFKEPLSNVVLVDDDVGHLLHNELNSIKIEKFDNKMGCD